MKLRACTLALALVVAGCAKPSLVGEWKGEQTHDGFTGTAQLSLKEDAQFSLAVSVVSIEGMPGLSRQVSSGTYKVSRDTLAMTVKNMRVDGVPVDVPPSGNTTRVRYTVRNNTLTLDLGHKNRLVLKRT